MQWEREWECRIKTFLSQCFISITQDFFSAPSSYSLQSGDSRSVPSPNSHSYYPTEPLNSPSADTTSQELNEFEVFQKKLSFLIYICILGVLIARTCPYVPDCWWIKKCEERMNILLLKLIAVIWLINKCNILIIKLSPIRIIIIIIICIRSSEEVQNTSDRFIHAWVMRSRDCPLLDTVTGLLTGLMA
jgi:hypothetical protein